MPPEWPCSLGLSTRIVQVKPSAAQDEFSTLIHHPQSEGAEERAD